MLDSENQTLKDILLNANACSAQNMKEAEEEFERTGKPLQQILIDEAAVLVDGYYNSCIVYNTEKVGKAHIYPLDYYWITDEIKPAGAK